MSTRKLLFTHFTSMLFVFFLMYFISSLLIDIVPGFLLILLGLYLGFTLPTKLSAWILKEELQAIVSEQSQDRD